MLVGHFFQLLSVSELLTPKASQPGDFDALALMKQKTQEKADNRNHYKETNPTFDRPQHIKLLKQDLLIKRNRNYPVNSLAFNNPVTLLYSRLFQRDCYGIFRHVFPPQIVKTLMDV
jgi:hypothetical protein